MLLNILEFYTMLAFAVYAGKYCVYTCQSNLLPMSMPGRRSILDTPSINTAVASTPTGKSQRGRDVSTFVPSNGECGYQNISRKFLSASLIRPKAISCALKSSVGSAEIPVLLSFMWSRDTACRART